jgi:hypothetical protein
MFDVAPTAGQSTPVHQLPLTLNRYPKMFSTLAFRLPTFIQGCPDPPAAP